MKRKVTLLICAVLLSGTMFLKAQQANTVQLPTVVRPSPDVQAMQKYGDIPVSPYTGVPDISIPIYTIKFRDITVPVSLSYHASGIKVSEEASRVGLGWVLNAGGSISRNIIGLDDFISDYFYSGQDYLYPPIGNVQNCCLVRTAGGNDNISSAIEGNFDCQPDQYYFNFMEHSGKFVVQKNKEIVLLKPEKLQIIIDQSGYFPVWHIKDINGYLYDFTRFENANNPGVITITAWYLTKITSPLGNQVSFNYAQLPNTILGPVGAYSQTSDVFDPLFPCYNNTLNPSLGSSISQTYPLITYTILALSSIDFPNGHVSFNYSDRTDIAGEKKLDSVSVYQKNPAGDVNATPIKTLLLKYSYFQGSANPNPAVSQGNDTRLRLDSVNEVGYYNAQKAIGRPYIFSYNQSMQLPSKTSASRDHWGYYNGKNNGENLVPSVIGGNQGESPDLGANKVFWIGYNGTERNTDTSFAKAFSLASIQYPTGSFTEFQYESNDFDEQASEVLDASILSELVDILPQSSANFGYSGTIHQVVTSDTLNVCNIYSNTNVTLSTNFIFSGNPQTVCSTLTGLYDNHRTGLVYFELHDVNGNTVLHIDPAAIPYISDIPTVPGSNPPIPMTAGSVYTTCTGLSLIVNNLSIGNLPPGKYTWSAYSATTGYAASLSGINVKFSWHTAINSNPPANCANCITYGYAGGLRIKRIIDHDGINQADDKIRKYIYHYYTDKNNDGISEEYSYGRRMAKPQYAYYAIMHATGNALAPCTDVHLMRCSDSNIPLNGSALGSAVGYDQVTELNGENGESGKIIYQYVNMPDAVVDYVDSTTQFPLRRPYGANQPNYLNGSLIKQTVYKNVNGQFIKIKQDSSAYTQKSAHLLFGLEQRPWLIGDNIHSGAAYDFFIYPCFFSYWTPLTSTDEKLFDQNDTTKYEEVLTNYYYNDTSHLLPTKVVVVNSKGELVTTTTQYPLSFKNISATDDFTKGVANLQSTHIINVPVEKYVQKSNTDGSGLHTVSAILSLYNASSPTRALTYQSQSSAPIIGFSPATDKASGFSKDASYQPFIYFDKYDVFGNVVQQHKMNDVNFSYIWDYFSSYPIAEAKNADSGSIAYTSFEADGTGNWNVGSLARNTVTAITGNRSYNLNNDISKSFLNSATIYIVSYWTQNSGAFAIAGTIAGYPAKGKTVNGWTLYVHKVTGQTSISIIGNGLIDELRLYPADAQMSTYTYDPLIGMTSQTDSGGRTTYYEYDGLGRLNLIRDQDRNILKRYCYNYAGQPVNCDGN